MNDFAWNTQIINYFLLLFNLSYQSKGHGVWQFHKNALGSFWPGFFNGELSFCLFCYCIPFMCTSCFRISRRFPIGFRSGFLTSQSISFKKSASNHDFGVWEIYVLRLCPAEKNSLDLLLKILPVKNIIQYMKITLRIHSTRFWFVNFCRNLVYKLFLAFNCTYKVFHKGP